MIMFLVLFCQKRKSTAPVFDSVDTDDVLDKLRPRKIKKNFIVKNLNCGVRGCICVKIAMGAIKATYGSHLTH